jgi:hypothetical protein
MIIARKQIITKSNVFHYLYYFKVYSLNIFFWWNKNHVIFYVTFLFFYFISLHLSDQFIFIYYQSIYNWNIVESGVKSHSP